MRRPSWHCKTSKRASNRQPDVRHTRTRTSQTYARQFPALSRRRTPTAPAVSPAFDRVLLGHDEGQRPVWLDDRARLEHLWCVGSTGSGKTTFAKNIILQDFYRGRGGLLIDPHGDLYRAVLAELYANGWLETGRVHLIDPNVRSHILPFNALAPLPGTDISVIADALLQAVEAVWDDENTHEKPAIRSNLKCAFMTLAELGLPLTDAKLLFDPDDAFGIRAHALTRLQNEYARDELERLHRIALADRSKREFNLEVRGPINRLNEFVSCNAVRTMLGITDEPDKPRRTFDFLQAMERGDMVLVNGEHGPAISEADADLLCAIILRYLFLLASRRRNREPWFVHIDECARVLTGDVPSLLAESRKYGIAVHLYHQFTAQLGKRDELLFQACLNSTEVKVVFRVKSAAEAESLAHEVIPLSLETPVQASVRPTVIAHRRVRFGSRSRTDSEAVTESVGESVGEMDALTEMESETEAVGSMSTTMNSVGSFDGAADSTGMVLSPTVQMLGPSAPNASVIQYPLSESVGRVASRGHAEQSGTASGESRMSATSYGTARTHARSRTTSRATARSTGVAHSVGETEGLEPVMQDLPAAFHGKENELYFAGERIRALPIGSCFVAYRGIRTRITVPLPKKTTP